MSQRIVPLLALVLAALVGGCGGEPTALERFRVGAGTTHYALTIDGRTIGALEERRSIGADGRPRIETRGRFVLDGSGRLDRHQTLLFAAEPPYRLLRDVLRWRGPDGDREQRTEDGGDRSLADYVSGRSGFASDLAAQGSPVGSEVRSGNDGAVTLELDDQGRPLRYRIGESFLLERVAEPPALPSPAAAAATTLHVPAEGALGARGRLDRLEVAVRGPAAALFRAGPGLSVRSAEAAIVLTSRRIRPPEPASETLRVAGRLIERVRATLDYVPGAAPLSLERTVARGEGDCWEFAALFEALAAAAGLEARTVTGLAWEGDDRGAFGLHAWNEVRLDGAWLALDPTWNQLPADAARLRFPDSAALQLDLQVALRDSRLEVMDAVPAPETG